MTLFYSDKVKVTNRFKGLDLIECLKNYEWRFMTSYRSTIPKKKKCKKAKWLSKEALQIAVNRRGAKGEGGKERFIPFECRVPKNSKER